jgi:phenylpropionate dioxygenase-like ring-hydroxylating dioxygenase large terminal subunit
MNTPGSDERFDFPPYPDSWIGVGWSHELQRGQSKPLSALGRELVLFRGNDGQVRALDAYCPHLGAHLGVDGSVVGNDIRCAFHGWCFDGSGACTKIEYASKIPPKARTRGWLVREANGMIFVWNDAAGRAPWFEIPSMPEFASDEWTTPRYHSFTIRTRWRELVENAVDRAHFFALHKYPEMPKLDFQVDGVNFRMKSQVPWKRFGRKLTVQLDIDGHGAGMAVTRGVGDLPFVVLGCPMPIDADRIIHRMTFLVSKKIPWPLREVMVRFVIFTALREFKRDIPIWENKLCYTKPVLCEGDGPIARFRTWAAQFYRGEAAAEKIG